MFFFTHIHLPPSSTLFPYTTLFRSPVRLVGLTFAVRPMLPEKPLMPASVSMDWREGAIGIASDGDSDRVLPPRSEKDTAEIPSPYELVCRLLLLKKKK